MSTAMSSPEQSSAATVKPQRVLACMLCQQRKIKCDHEFPCANCARASMQCVPSPRAPRPRRRRFHERELLERLRRYESLLRQNNIKFEPLDTPAPEHASPGEDGRGSDSVDDAHLEGVPAGADQPSIEKTTVKSETVYKAKNLWHAMNQRLRDPEEDDNNDDGEDGDDSDFAHDDVRETVVKKAWDQLYGRNDHLLFGPRRTNVDLSALHPSQVQIFRLWQIYLENVNPLLKVTHTPTLQARIIDSASDIANISPTLEALMFSIYCVSILSLVEDECSTLFGSPKKDLLTSFQFGCQQALLDSGILRCNDVDSLTALYLYLISVRSDTDPRSLSSMLGVAIRIAQRMGIDNESTYAKHNALEAEMRRRLWWSLIIFDNRICEMSHHQSTILAPTWDCKIPLNVNDFDMRPEAKTPPATHERPTEALFAVVRSELGEFVRHSSFHLDFTNPSLKEIAKDIPHGPAVEGSKLIALEKTIEDKYLKYCIPENPLHFMTLWTTRGQLAKNRLVEHYSRYSRSSVQQTDTQRDTANSHALSMLECDTKLMTSDLTKGYHWHIDCHFPFPAYIHLFQDLKKRPVEKHAEKSWEVMSENFEAHYMKVEQGRKPLLEVFARILLQAWEAREAVFRQLGTPLEPPRIVSGIKHIVMQMTSNAQNNAKEQPNSALGMNMNDSSMPVPMDFGGHGLLYGMGWQLPAGLGPGGYPDIFPEATMEVDVDQLDWTTVDWNSMQA